MCSGEYNYYIPIKRVINLKTAAGVMEDPSTPELLIEKEINSGV